MSPQILIAQLIRQAHQEGRNTLLEPELYEVLKAGGVAVPAFYVTDGTSPQSAQIPGTRVVLKVISPAITHKTEMGGVRIVDNRPESIAGGARAILDSVRDRGGEALLQTVKGVLVSEFVTSDGTLGSQLFAGMRFAPDMGHVLALGFGGLEAEALAAQFRPGQGTVLFSPELLSVDDGLEKFSHSYAARLMMGQTREARERLNASALRNIIAFFAMLAHQVSNRPESGFTITDFEINPFFLGDGTATAVDAFLRFSMETHEEKRVDLERVGRLLRPQTAAVMGASASKLNVGRIILRNLLREDFAREQIRVIRPESQPGDEVDGVECVASIRALPWDADLLVVAVGAEAVPDVVEEALDTGNVASMVLIPGGMGETEGGKAKEQSIKESLARVRKEGKPAPVMVGPNCLGVRSRPGRVDTLFIPQLKLPMPTGRVRNAALISQSGAFMITRMNRIPVLDPLYTVSTGNQLDLTYTDFVEALLHDAQVEVMGIYIEGFKPLDGRRLARLIREGRRLGKDFIVYKAGRTAVGQTATSSHTASISGDYASAVEVLRDAGALMAHTFEEFKAFLTYSGLYQGKRFAGYRLGIISNAGYETVGMADNMDEKRFALSPLTEVTRKALKEALGQYRLSALVNPHNPLDLTPMAPDAAFGACVRAFLNDETVDALLVGAVPMTVAMKTLPPHVDPRDVDTIDAPDSFPSLLAEIFAETDKPMAAVVDTGVLYDPLAQRLEESGIPTFRSSDLAMQTLQRYLAYKNR